MKLLELISALAIAAVSAMAQSDLLQTWTWLSPPSNATRHDPPLQNAFLSDAARGNGRLLVLGFQGGEARKTVILSRDVKSGLDAPWIDRGSGLASEDLSGILFANGIFLVWGPAGLWTSVDGVSWAKRIIDVYITALVYGDGQFLGFGNPNSVLTSTDGDLWKVRDLPSELLSGVNGTITSAAYGNQQFIAVGGNGSCGGPVTNVVIRSSSGFNWTRVYSGINNVGGCSGFLESVAFGGGRFVAVGGGIVMVSDDGSSWSRQEWQEGYRLHQIAHGNGQFLAAAGGDNISPGGTKLYLSMDGVRWTPLELNFDPSPYGRIGFSGGYFTCVGMELVVQSKPIISLEVAPQSTPGSMSLLMRAPDSMDYILQSSSDLHSWRDFRVIPAHSSTQLVDNLSSAPAGLYFRLKAP